MTPLISVIIPVYNVEPYIERAILSVLDQTMTECECLVIDDCGSDGSMDIVRSLQQRHPAGSKIRVIRQARNGGLGEARNTGIDLAKGEYVYFLDGDDYIAPDCIEQLYCAAEKYHADFATGIFLLEDPQGQIVSGEVKTDLPVLYSGRREFIHCPDKGHSWLGNQYCVPALFFNRTSYSEYPSDRRGSLLVSANGRTWDCRSLCSRCPLLLLSQGRQHYQWI